MLIGRNITTLYLLVVSEYSIGKFHAVVRAVSKQVHRIFYLQLLKKQRYWTSGHIELDIVI